MLDAGAGGGTWATLSGGEGLHLNIGVTESRDSKSLGSLKTFLATSDTWSVDVFTVSLAGKRDVSDVVDAGTLDGIEALTLMPNQIKVIRDIHFKIGVAKCADDIF